MKAIPEVDFEGVKLNAGVKVGGESGDDARAQVRFSVSCDVDERGGDGQKGGGDRHESPFERAVSSPEGLEIVSHADLNL